MYILRLFNKNIFVLYNHFIMKYDKQSYKKFKNPFGVTFKNINLDNIGLLKGIGGFDIDYLEKLLLKFSSDKIIGIAAYKNDEIVGYAWCGTKGTHDRQYIIKDADYYIFDVFVSESFRGGNIAPLMLSYLIKHKCMRENDCKICLAVRIDNEAAIRAYTKIGFKIVTKKRFCRILKINIPQRFL